MVRWLKLLNTSDLLIYFAFYLFLCITCLVNKLLQYNTSYHRCTQGGGGVRGGMKQHPPRQIFKKLDNKNAIKRKIGGPPLAIFPETLDPP